MMCSWYRTEGSSKNITGKWWNPEAIQGFTISVKTLSSVQSLCHVRLFETTWTAACQTSRTITNSQN